MVLFIQQISVIIGIVSYLVINNINKAAMIIGMINFFTLY
jgi:hypothetical protein